jgi:hypothetical protein
VLLHSGLGRRRFRNDLLDNEPFARGQFELRRQRLAGHRDFDTQDVLAGPLKPYRGADVVGPEFPLLHGYPETGHLCRLSSSR